MKYVGVLCSGDSMTISDANRYFTLKQCQPRAPSWMLMTRQLVNSPYAAVESVIWQLIVIFKQYLRFVR